MAKVGDFPFVSPTATATSRDGVNLFASLNVYRHRDVIDMVERKVDKLVAHRHDYPIWPHHNEALDPYEVSFHGLIRRPYYRVTIDLIQVLRALRDLA